MYKRDELILHSEWLIGKHKTINQKMNEEIVFNREGTH